ncbi:uncharacterized protein LOC128558571 [Mercenaria mercenaria]|uniref:uncharacterized protein LOC128558571 n=1 Tax=Mercenaria mercenaria TaxID=6596 RepID=UPI00234F04DE|nr:uncharacterized protein LOC128558571 [Mercenaria mercenaria]
MPSKKNKRKQRRVLSEGDAAQGSSSVHGGAGTTDPAQESSYNSITAITQNISGTNVQVGHGNVIEDKRRHKSDTTDGAEYTGACALPPDCLDQERTYADVVTGRVVKQHIQADRVTININANTGTVESENVSRKETESKEQTAKIAQFKREQVALFLNSVDNFSRGHFILAVGKQNTVDYIQFEALSLVPWTVVFDFDPESRSTGLLSSIESILSKRRSLHIDSIQGACTFSEQITSWIFLMGCSDRPDTRTATEAGDWKKEVDEEVDKKLSNLKQFEAGITHFTFVVFWPSDPNTAKCMHFILSKVCTRMSSSVVIVEDGEMKSDVSVRNLNVLKDEKEVTVVELGIKELCQAVTKVMRPIIMESSSYYLPTKDNSNDPGITEEKAQWLKEDIEVLYVNNKTGVKYTSQQMKIEEDTFHKGGTLPWTWWYEVGPGHADVERDITKRIVHSIKQNYLDIPKSGIITLLHSPGSGGTTLSQRVLWDLKDRVPCAQMKQNSGSSVTDLVEKITYLSDRTNMPIVILLDGEDEHRIRSLQKLSERMKICVIMLYVRRYYVDAGDYEGRKDIYVLTDTLSKREARVLKLKFSDKIDHEKRRKNVEQLAEDVENDKNRTIFEFGLAAHSYEYQGIQSYVRGYLQLSESEDDRLLPWQTSLAYLSLVYFYGHTSVPCHFFTDILRSKDNKMILETKDFPPEMQEFIVRGVNESRMYTVRISHYYVAREILDQVLTRPVTIERHVSPYLCSAAKKMLGTFCPGLIKEAGKVNDGNSSEVISKMLINTFIKREHIDILEDETQDARLKGPNKPRFSHILEDASSTAPFSERFDILQQLVVSFPSEAQFRAHLGRLYMICRPEEEEKAEENLKKAYEMSSAILDETESVDEIPFSRRLDIRNICHMYGNMLSKKVFKYTGKCSTDKPVIVVRTDQFLAIAESLLPDVQFACKLFSTNREVMSPGYEECLGFVGEIHVRLMFCRLVKEKSGAADLEAFASTNDGEVAQFVNDCYSNLDVLFDELCDVADAKSMEVNGQPLQEIYMDIMSSTAPGHIVYKQNRNTPRVRRNEIGKIKARYNTKNSHGYLEKLTQEDEIKFIVDCYEKNFQTTDSTDKALDNDYREWIRAIRHPEFPNRYSIEVVLRHVENWYEHVQKQNNPWKKITARFYYFVLSSILGFGAFGQSGNLELLRKSQILRKDLLEIAKYSQNPDYQIEWLGLPVATIDRLIPGKRCFGLSGDLPLKEEDLERLEIRLGTVCPPNNKPNNGLIALDLGPGNRENVKIHYVPIKWKMKGKSFKSCRVQFVIGFNMSHGYEAFMVQRVEHVKCLNSKCGTHIERRSCDNTVKCPTCLQETKIKHT